MSLKSTLRGISERLDQADAWLEQMLFRAIAASFGLKVGNVYSPIWAPDTRVQIVGLDSGYIVYETYTSARDRAGWWVRGGGGRDSSPFNWWLSHAFTQYCPPGSTDVILQ